MRDPIESVRESSSIEQLNSLIKKAQDEIERKKVDEIQLARRQWLDRASILGMSPEGILKYSGRRKGKPKYRNPNNPEQTWTGRGKKPNWLKDASDPEAYRIPE